MGVPILGSYPDLLLLAVALPLSWLCTRQFGPAWLADSRAGLEAPMARLLLGTVVAAAVYAPWLLYGTRRHA